MLAAPKLADLTHHEREHPGALCCLLFAPPFSKTAKEGIVPRLGYLSSRSADDIDFYCAGYGGYWQKRDFPDMEFIGDVRYADGVRIPWSFSQKEYSAFVDEFEQASTWRYSGETELIVFNALASFEDCLVLDIERMIADDAIDRPSALFESLIQYARSSSGRANAFQFSDGKAPSIFAKAVLDVIAEGPKALGKAWKAGRHFAVRNIRK
jgi:hypothetical protein